MRRALSLALAAAAVLVGLPQPAAARVEKVTVHGASLEGNLEGNSPDRKVYVILPPSYDSAKKRRYPVVYFLHGFTGSADKTMATIPFDAALKAAGTGPQEMIVVVPDSYTRHGGSMYSSSPTVGDFERFVARDLVSWVDRKFRTLARRESRGLAGHSMGGYGTLRIGMKHADVFSSLYAMNPCCLTPRPAETAEQRFETMTPEQVAKGDFMTLGNFAVAAAWSPNPQKPPFYADLATRDGKPVPLVLAQWAANAPQALAPQYLPALRSLTAIAMDAGDADFVLHEGTGMHETLTQLGVKHGWTVYPGDHGNKVPERFGSVVLPFFAAHLKPEAQ